ncbi:MAG: hypothetical protein QM650_08355 [Microlunatus sp.]
MINVDSTRFALADHDICRFDDEHIAFYTRRVDYGLVNGDCTRAVVRTENRPRWNPGIPYSRIPGILVYRPRLGIFWLTRKATDKRGSQQKRRSDPTGSMLHYEATIQVSEEHARTQFDFRQTGE